ncbi:hypothetical protein FRC00_006941, partial [Tulasnella sp. 408]
MSKQPSTSDSTSATATTPAVPTSTQPAATTTSAGDAPAEASSLTTATPPPLSQSSSTSSAPSASKKPATDKPSRRTSLVKTFFKKLRDSSPKPRRSAGSSNKQPNDTAAAPVNEEVPLSGSGAILENKEAEKNAVNLSDSVDPTTAGDATAQPPSSVVVDQSHPGQIIPHTEKKHPGEDPVQPRPLRNPYYAGVLNEVDVLVTKEAEKIMRAMSDMVENSGHVGGGLGGDIPLNVRATLYPHSASTAELGLPKKKWFENWATGMLDKLFAAHNMGVYVITDRKTKANIFETMPIFTRLGMHLLFVTVNHEILDMKAVEGLFSDVSFRQGKIYDNPDPAFVIPHIEAFIEAYDIKLEELLEPDIKKYKTFNDFFKRSLKPGARTVQDANDLSIITSLADSRLTVFKNVGDAKKFWIKGQEFTLASLLDDQHLAETFGKNPSIAIFRLAPQDYHRYHAPFKAKLGKMFHVPGTYFTVNPQAVNHDLDVFTVNRRDIQLLHADVRNPTSTTTSPQQAPEPVTFAFVSVGALLVGSIGWSKNPGDSVMKGEDLGFFQYGGSTVILVAPEGTVEWDEDLVANSSGLSGVKGVEAGKPLETL